MTKFASPGGGDPEVPIRVEVWDHDHLSFNDLIGAATTTLSEILICTEAQISCEWVLEDRSGKPSGTISLANFSDVGLDAFFDANTRSSIAAIRPKLAKLKSNLQTPGTGRSRKSNSRRLNGISTNKSTAYQNIELACTSNSRSNTYENIELPASTETTGPTYDDSEFPASKTTATNEVDKTADRPAPPQTQSSVMAVNTTFNGVLLGTPAGLAVATASVPLVLADAELLLGDITSVAVDTDYMPEFDWDASAESGTNPGAGDGNTGGNGDRMLPAPASEGQQPSPPALQMLSAPVSTSTSEAQQPSLPMTPIFVFEEEGADENIYDNVAWESTVI